MHTDPPGWPRYRRSTMAQLLSIALRVLCFDRHEMFNTFLQDRREIACFVIPKPSIFSEAKIASLHNYQISKKRQRNIEQLCGRQTAGMSSTPPSFQPEALFGSVPLT